MGEYKPKRSRRERWMAILACILAILMLLPMVVMVVSNLSVASATNTSDLQNQIDSLKSKNKDLAAQKGELKNKLSGIQAEKSQALDKKHLLEEQINLLQEEINNLNQQLETYAALIQEKEREVAENEAREAAQMLLFQKQCRAMEKEGQVSYWSILFSADSFPDLLDKVHTVNSIADYNDMVCDQLQLAREALKESKRELEKARAETEEVKGQQEEAKAEVQRQESEVQKLINQISADEKLTQQAIDDLNAAAKAMDAEIAKKERELQAAIAAANQSGGGGSYQFDPGSGFVWPLPAKWTTITSFFGPRSDPFTGKSSNHSGTDIAASSGTEIYAAHGGVVLTSTSHWSYGNYVVVSRGDGISTLYAHMSRRAVSAGDTVKQGQVIGYVGSTGRSTGPHLHYEVRLNGNRQDALKYHSNVSWTNRTGYSYK